MRPIHEHERPSPEHGDLAAAPTRRWPLLYAAALVVAITGCAELREPRIGERLPRTGQEIVVAGQLFHVGAPVVLWIDEDGYDAYRPWKHFEAEDEGAEQKARYGARRLTPSGRAQTDAEALAAKNGQWSLADLREVVDQFVIHYDVCGTSEVCYRVLQDGRGLSVHFMLDVDGTIYQTLDLDERAWHATIANDRSVGIEIAQPGAATLADRGRLDEWYEESASGGPTRVTLPERFGDGGVATTGFEGFSARAEPVVGAINGTELVQYDFTPQQYESLAKLTAALHRALPRIELDYPREADGSPLMRTMTRAEFDRHSGLIGHYHVQSNKQDPGPAFDWERVVRDARGHLEGR
ncbi:N-acetyl-anhydromuranmyl-L-alanine amidase [Planctomycetes bacterium Pla163]|uniref:N-acetylmuramoyl-L-alanine amidase n=1 Tax=Rohdeia mirabilis TaxID=2528008 RepID=A0A518D0Y2_9BACT|nr:N-acetyl-anhydromuranmyl-L-alanine amidase [Planctomycetes bacterium Pla163]